MSPLPELPAHLRQECRLPGIGRDAVRALGEHRLALVECRRRHQRLVEFYEKLTPGARR